MRLYNIQTEVVVTEKCSMQKINTEACHLYEYKPHLTLSILYNVFQALVVLKPGNYILQHTNKHGPFVAILQETEDLRLVIFKKK